MADKTTYLQLNKPGANARGWGSALNSNMDILDSAYNSTNSRINSIQLQLGEMNYISFLPNQDYVQFQGTGNYTSFDTGYVTQTVGSDGKITLTFNKVKTYGSGSDPYTEIPDFTGFYVFNTIQAKPNADAPYDTAWSEGEILVKTSEISNNQRIATFVKFPQALGGYYKPTEVINNTTGQTSGVGPNFTIKFEKVLPRSAEEEATITLPAGVVQGTWKNIQVSTFDNDDNAAPYEYTYILSDLSSPFPSTIYIPPVDVRFFEVNGTKVQKVEVDYWFTNTTTQCTLHIELAERPDQNLWCSYIVYKTT